MKLIFKINKYYILGHALRSTNSPFQGWENFQDRLYQISNTGYYIFRRPELALVNINNENDLRKFFSALGNDFKKIIKTTLKSKDFFRLLEETKDYHRFVKNQWEKNQVEVTRILEELTGFKLPDEEITVYITHPKLYNGISLPDKKFIGWGHPEDWENYTTVYLTHEFLHIILGGKIGLDETSHAIVELIADNELRTRLNPGSLYFKESGYDVGHNFLKKTIKLIMPHWKKYLKTKKKDIVSFYNEMKKV